MTEQEVVRGQELIEEIQAAKAIIKKLEIGISAELSTLSIIGFEKDSREASATLRHTTKPYEYLLNVSRSSQRTRELTVKYIKAVKESFESDLAVLEKELAALGKERTPAEVIAESDDVLNEMADAALGVKEEDIPRIPRQ